MTLVYFILILGIIVFVHELGHFIFAKKAGIYVYEFSIGMGPKIWSFKRKNDETKYCIGIIPIGGYVKMAGEEIEEDLNIPANKRMQSKTWGERLITIVAGALFNFLLAIILLFFIGLIYGTPESKPFIGDVMKDYPAYKAGIREGDLILSINNKKISTWDDVTTILMLDTKGKSLTFKVRTDSNDTKIVEIIPKKEITDGKTSYKVGISTPDKTYHGIIPSIKYAFVKTWSIIKSVGDVLGALVTGALGLNNLAGPVGIYKIVGQESQYGIGNLVYLVAFLSIQVGLINLFPLPAFDGGRALFLLIEKIRRAPVNQKVENIIHGVGFLLLMALMVAVTINDIKSLIIK